MANPTVCEYYDQQSIKPARPKRKFNVSSTKNKRKNLPHRFRVRAIVGTAMGRPPILFFRYDTSGTTRRADNARPGYMDDMPGLCALGQDTGGRPLAAPTIARIPNPFGVFCFALPTMTKSGVHSGRAGTSSEKPSNSRYLQQTLHSAKSQSLQET